MANHVQCLVCRHMLSTQNRDKASYADLDVDYAYCERCYREKVGELETTIASYRSAACRYNEAQVDYWLRDHARRLEFLASGWQLEPKLHPNLPSTICNNELGRRILTCEADLMFSDVLLVPADGPPIAAHKAILVGRSPVFRAMFCSCPMREAKDGVVLMEDMSVEVLAAFVEFFYTANITEEIMQKHSAGLLSAAEKYDVVPLRVLCEHAIANQIGCHNAISTLELARKFDSQVLWAAVLDFASQDMEHLPAFEEYQAYAAKDPGLLLDLYKGLVDGKKHANMDTRRGRRA